MTRRSWSGSLAALVGLLVSLAPSAAVADSIDCAGGIISVHDSRADLLGKCGPPALIEIEPYVPNAPPLALPLERWSYNFGSSRFLQIVTLQGGEVLAIERGGYGYDSASSQSEQARALPRAGCDHDVFHVGDTTLDVLEKCGEPAFREVTLNRTATALHDTWVYNFGPQSLLRFLDFSRGRLVRIRTGGYGY